MIPLRLKKFIPIHAFARRSSPAPTGPPSTPDDWVRHAMDTARLAATASDDLICIPSIRDIASIFTQMLQQLQEMEENRDEFYQITREIGSLIETIIHDTREHSATSSVFAKVCDDFLSTITSMQSEMAHIFRASVSPIKRFSKTKPYEGVLRNYGLHFTLLRSDLRASILSSSSPTGILSNAREFAIIGGTLTDVQGNQSIFHNHGTVNIQTLQVPTRQMDDLDLSDYREFKFGDLHAISVPRKRPGVQEFAVSINNEIMTARTYTGDDALQSFKNDVRMILGQKFRNTHFIQLFGVCLSKTVPTLIFHRDLKPLSRFMHPEPRDNLRLKFQIFREWQAVCRYLVQDCQFRAAHWYLDQLGNTVDRRKLLNIPYRTFEDDGGWHLYLDNFEHLQVSIESPNERESGSYVVRLPTLSLHEMEGIEFALSHGTLDDAYHIDKKACLLAMHAIQDVRNKRNQISDPLAFQAAILVSPMRRAGAARLTFDSEHRFHFQSIGWNAAAYIKHNPSIDMSSIAIGSNSWTRFTIPHHIPSVQCLCHWRSVIECYSEFDASSLYLKAWLAQTERIKQKIRSLCTSRETMVLATRVKRYINFQCCRFPLSHDGSCQEPVFFFVQDLQDVDSVFDIAWFWARDPKGLAHLSEADILSLGLREPCLSKIYVEGRLEMLCEPRLSKYVEWQDLEMEELRIFHEALGFAAGSSDIPHVLELPIASVEWDGDEIGPLTPWELMASAHV